MPRKAMKGPGTCTSAGALLFFPRDNLPGQRGLPHGLQGNSKNEEALVFCGIQYVRDTYG